MASKDTEHDQREDEEAAPAEDEDTGGQFAPVIRLEEVAVTTGEENEDAILDLKAKLYRFDKEGNQWKERGVGSVKLLKHKETRKVRLVMRQAKTLKICANHLIGPNIAVQEHAGNEKSCVWHAADFADGELKVEMFCIRFGSVDNCKSFTEMIQEAAENLKTKEENEDATATATATAGLLEKLTVEEKKPDDSTGRDVPASSDKEVNTEDESKKAYTEKKTENVTPA